MDNQHLVREALLYQDEYKALKDLSQPIRHAVPLDTI